MKMTRRDKIGIVLFLLIGIVIVSEAKKCRGKFYGCTSVSGRCKCATARFACKNPFKYPSMNKCMKHRKYIDDPCLPNPCDNNGKCVARETVSRQATKKYRCDCTKTGHYGKRCHKPCPSDKNLTEEFLWLFIDRKYLLSTPWACLIKSKSYV